MNVSLSPLYNPLWLTGLKAPTNYWVLLYGWETWILLADSEERIQVFETTSMRKLLRISYLEHKTKDWEENKINFLVGPEEPLLATVKRWKRTWLEHVKRHDSLSKTILQAILEGGRRRGRQRKCWMDNIKEWTSQWYSKWTKPMTGRRTRSTSLWVHRNLFWQL